MTVKIEVVEDGGKYPEDAEEICSGIGANVDGSRLDEEVREFLWNLHFDEIESAPSGEAIEYQVAIYHDGAHKDDLIIDMSGYGN